jgi:hypothetical protein
MIVCRKCSRRHPDDTEFCDCGAYLAFDGERIADAPSVAPPQGPPASTLAPPTGASSWQAVEPAAREAPRRAPDEAAPWSGLPGESSWGGSTPDPGPTSTVDARLPDAPLRDTTAPVWVEPTTRAGDIPCPQCGSMNNPDRQFCHHCGHLLATGAAIAGGGAGGGRSGGGSVPWWRRLGRSARARGANLDPSNLAMDARRLTAPGGLSSRVMMIRTGGIALLAVGLLGFLGPWRTTVISHARTLIGGKQYVAINGDGIKAEELPSSPTITSQSIPQEVADNVLDRHANTAWGTRWLAAVPPPAPAAPADPAATTTTAAPATTTPVSVPAGACSTDARTDSFLRFKFDEPTDVGRIEILPGRYDADKARASYTRPQVVELKVGDKCTSFRLLDKGSLQALKFAADDVEELDLRILDVYREDTSSPTVEISEVVFERER